MAKTTKPIWVIAPSQLCSLPEFVSFREKGNRVQELHTATGEDLLRADVICGPQMFRMFPETVKYFDAMIKGVRQVVYGGKVANNEGT